MIYKQYVEELHTKIEGGLQIIDDMQRILDTQSAEILMLRNRVEALEPSSKTALEQWGEDITVAAAEELHKNRIPPEKIPEVKASRLRVKKAEKLFNDHFDPSGNPKTLKGEKLSAKYKY